MLVEVLLVLASLQSPMQSPMQARMHAPMDTSARVTPTPVAPAAPVAPATPADTPTVRRRHAVSYSDQYYTRLTIHRYGSYIMLPLFAAEYSLGQNLINDASPPSWMKPSHTGVALGIGALFTVNTITGAWNLWESRDDPSGRTRRFLHTGLMLASDAGFLITGALTPKHSFDPNEVRSSQNRHRNWALGSIALSTAGSAMMWFWKQ